MGWQNFYRRRDAIQAVLDHAGSHPEDGLPLARLEQAQAEFADERDLLLALHYKWTQALTGYLNVTPQADTEPLEAIGTAWRRAAAANPVLRALLDTHLAGSDDPALRAARERELRMLALATGLAGPHEPNDELVKIGAAYAALLAATPQRLSRPRPLGRLRKLVATG